MFFICCLCNVQTGGWYSKQKTKNNIHIYQRRILMWGHHINTHRPTPGTRPQSPTAASEEWMAFIWIDSLTMMCFLQESLPQLKPFIKGGPWQICFVYIPSWLVKVSLRCCHCCYENYICNISSLSVRPFKEFLLLKTAHSSFSHCVTTLQVCFLWKFLS